MFHRFRRASSSSVDSLPTPPRRESLACEPDQSCEGLSTSDMRQLWRCMLELQERYGCYHSARLDVALAAGDEGVNYMPNRFIIDTLNHSVRDFLPEEGLVLLDKCLHPDSLKK